MMKRWRSFYLLLIILTGLFIASITVAVMLGPVPIRPETVWRIALSHLPLFGDSFVVDWSRGQENIVWEVRFPRVMLAAVVGAGLSVVGVAIQALVRNSLADPYILGVSSGASVGATSVILFGTFSFLGQWALSASAFLGALVAVVVVVLLAQVGGRLSPVRLLLAGIAVSAVFSALTSLIVFMAKNEAGIRNALFWLMGSFAGAKWEQLLIPALVVAIAMILLLVRSSSLNALLMGEETANTLGVNVRSFRLFLLVLSSLVTGVVVAVCGAIGFVGLMMPHIVRLLVGSDHRRVLPISALLGALFLIWADVLARMVVAPEELPIGIITSLSGAPFFLWLLRRNSYRFGGDGR
ncbi:FecCD family ABC transporter permease [Tumebacillus lipolyticus]|uniref:FecCD family ABC transporter permease n=1 Tax=Tumebacillus lipolyticus TaxID=1280370 RepID=A0ABW4ZX92_9BACL